MLEEKCKNFCEGKDITFTIEAHEDGQIVTFHKEPDIQCPFLIKTGEEALNIESEYFVPAYIALQRA